MNWLRLTQANTGVTIHINMDQVILIAPNKTGGSALLTTVLEKDSGRIVPVKETPQEIGAMLDQSAAALRAK